MTFWRIPGLLALATGTAGPLGRKTSETRSTTPDEIPTNLKSAPRQLSSFIIALVCCWSSINECLSAPPTLTHLFPAGGQRGTKVTVTCTGKFKWPEQVWASGVETVPAAESGKLEVTIPADLAADRVWIRLFNSEGASSTQPFLIGGLKEKDEVEPNDKPLVAQVIETPDVTINGALKDRDVDCFAVQLTAGQMLVAALDANTRLGSPMDAILQIVTPEGFVLAENHDDLKLDPRLPFKAERTGTYVVRLFAFPSAPNTSIQFSGGADYIYRLTLTTGPYATHAIPLSAPLEAPAAISLAGWNVPPEIRLNVVPFGGTRLVDHQEFEVMDDMRRSRDARIGFAFAPDFPTATRVRLTPFAVSLMTTPVDPQNPPIIGVPSSVTGCLKMKRQTDVYRLPLLKGQSVLVSVETRGLDLPLDPVLQLIDPSGSKLGENDDTGQSRESIIAHTAAKDGEYRISVNDRMRQGGERCWYLLTTRIDQPDFELTAAEDSVVVASDKPAELTVKVQRRGPSATPVGAIAIQAIGLPESVTCPIVTSETTGPTATEIKLSLTSTGAAFSGPVKIVGKATQPNEIERSVRTPAKLGVAFESIFFTAIAKP